MPPIDRARFRDAAGSAVPSLPTGARSGPNASPRLVDARSAHDEPTLLVLTTSGFCVELLIGAGLDIGHTSFEGHPISWGTPVDASWPPVAAPRADWLGRWQGGLLTTCGLRNVGAPSLGIGLHGDFIFRAAAGVVAEHVDIDSRPAVRVTGQITDAPALGTPLVLHRSVIVFDDAPEIRVEDVLRNLGDESECAPMMYHVNLGSPFLTPDTRVEGVERLSVRDDLSAWLDGWPVMGRPAAGETELVAEASLTRPGHVQAVNEAAGIRFVMTWSEDSLPRMHVWRRRRADAYVLALEPATGSLLGREHELSTKSSMLAGGAERRTSLHLALLPDIPSTNGDDDR